MSVREHISETRSPNFVNFSMYSGWTVLPFGPSFSGPVFFGPAFSRPLHSVCGVGLVLDSTAAL